MRVNEYHSFKKYVALIFLELTIRISAMSFLKNDSPSIVIDQPIGFHPFGECMFV
jgi:hypothetical protein